jgi:hypothetical protein
MDRNSIERRRVDPARREGSRLPPFMDAYSSDASMVNSLIEAS